MKTTTHLIPDGAGRRVAVEDYGDPRGRPVFFFHGWPSSRRQGALAHEAAIEAGVRLLAVDRPGCGGSDLHEGRTLGDWPSLLAAVADRLALERFAVLGVSGGGPYALASAWAMPGRVTGAAVVSGAPPLATAEDVAGLMPIYRGLLAAYRRAPGLLRLVFRGARVVATSRPPAWLWRAALRVIPRCDRVALSDPAVLERAWAGYAGAWASHPDGVFHDARIYAAPWGFDPGTLRVPVALWHGREDRNFHWSLAQRLAARIPECRVTMIDGEGHYSLIIRHHREVLRALIS